MILREMNKFCFIAIFCATSVASCFALFQNNYELTYDFKSRITSGIIGRCDNSSDFAFNSTITIKTYPNLTYVTLKNFAYAYVLGEDSLVPIKNAAKLPESILKMPFVIRYDENDLITDILTEAKDEGWSINIKRGIASLFQIDMKHKTPKRVLQHSFYSEENTITGRCKVTYTTKPGKGEHGVVVVKQIDMSSCQDQTWTDESKTDDQPVSVLSTRTYAVSSFIDSIINENIITTSPITGGTYIQMINTTQTLTLVSSGKLIEKSLPSIDTMITRTLNINFTANNNNQSDITCGRMTFDTVTIENELKTLFEVLTDDDKIFTNIGSSISKNEDLVRTIVKKMELLDESQLGNVLELLKGNNNATNTFFKTIQFVGTRSSIIFIKNYLLKNPNKISLSITNWKNPDLDTLKEYSVLMKPENNFDVNLKKKIIFSFSILISKYISTHGEHQVSDLIQLYIDGLKSSKNESEQIIYILAMKNIHSLATRSYLESLINGEVGEFTPYCRSIAVWALQGSYKASPKILDRMFLSLISNTSEECNVRCTALHVYLAEPTVTKLMQLTTFMEMEQHGEVYSSYYTKLTSMASLKAPCYKQVANYARTILKQLSPVPYAVNIQNIFDSYDPENNVVNTMTFSMAGHLYKDGYFTVYFDLPDLFEEQTSIFIRFMLDYPDLDKSKRFLVGNEYFRNVKQELMLAININFDAIILRDGIVQAPIIENVSAFGVRYTTMLTSSLVSSFSFSDHEVVIPTDIGLPIIFFTNKLTRERLYFEVVSNAPWLRLVIDFTSKVAIEHGVKFYNPVANIWQGVKRNNVMHTDIPLNVTFDEILGSTPSLTYLFNHTKNGLIKTTGVETLVYNDVYVEDYGGSWKKSCPTCHTNLLLTNGNQKQFTIWKNIWDMIGINYELGLYNCETNVGQVQISEIRNMFLKGVNQKSYDISFYSKVLSLMGSYRNAFFLPKSDYCGVSLMIKPDHRNSILTFARYPKSPEKIHSLDYTMNDDEGTRGWSILWEMPFTMPPSVIFSLTKSGKDTTTIRSVYSLYDTNMTQNFTVSTINSTNVDDSTNITISISAGLEHIITHDVVKTYDECLAKGLDWEGTAQATYLNSYEYEINFDMISIEHKKLWRRMSYLFHAVYEDYFVYSEDIQKCHKNTIKIIVSLQSHNTADITVLTEFDSFHYMGVPMDSLIFDVLLQPVSTHMPIIWHRYLSLSSRHMVSCDATKDYIKMQSGVKYNEPAGDEWTDLMSLRNEEDKECIFCTYYRWQNETKLGLRLVTSGGTLEAYKLGGDNNMHLVWKDKPLIFDSNGYFLDDVIKIKILDPPRMFLRLRESMLNIDFNESQIRIHFSRDKSLLKNGSGKCLKNDLLL